MVFHRKVAARAQDVIPCLLVFFAIYTVTSRSRPPRGNEIVPSCPMHQAQQIVLLGFFVAKQRTPLEPLARCSLDEMGSGTLCLAMAIKPFCRQKLSGISCVLP